jgi:hypothetical protein
VTKKQPKPPRGRRFLGHEPGFTIIDAMDRLFPQWFYGDSWDGWRSILRAIYCLPMSEQDRAFFKLVAERDPPTKRPREVWIIAGRRSGKSAITSLVASFSAIFFKTDVQQLRPGEKARVLALAVDKSQARVVRDFCASYFQYVAPLRSMIVRETMETIELANDVSISIAPNSFRSIRGISTLFAALDEVAFWRSETSSAPDAEVYNAITPSLATLRPNSMLIGISSAYRRSGLIYDKFRKYYGTNDPNVLVIKATTKQLNPLIDQQVIDQDLADDPAKASAEWLSEFRSDLSSYIDPVLIESAVDIGVTVRPPEAGKRYVAWIDASSGASDSFALAIAHAEGRDLLMLDNLTEVRAPFDTAAATQQIADVLKAYGLSECMGDDYAKGWVISELARHGIRFTARPTEMNRSALYLETLSLFSAGRVRLVDNKRLVSQYAQLERRVMPAGRDVVDHPNRSGHHDDLSNVCAGVLWRLQAGIVPMVISPELLQRVLAMPKNPHRALHHNRWLRHGGLGMMMNALAPRERQGVSGFPDIEQYRGEAK